MNRVTLAIVVIVASLIVGGFIGWHMHPKLPPVEPVNIDGTTSAIEDANARADSFLVDTVRIPVPIRTHEKLQSLAGADTARLFGILDRPVQDGL